MSLPAAKLRAPFRLMFLAAGAFLLAVLAACQSFRQATGQSGVAPVPEEIPVADGFDYPVGKKPAVTQKRDHDGWYNAQDFTENNHLAEDWNGDGGGNSDCGQPVYAAARGVVIYAGEVTLGWGNVVIIRHRLPDGKLVETQYGHLQKILKTGGVVARREQIGTVGDGGGRYLCHLHFELRTPECPAWGTAGPGYGQDTTGWLDPSDFIDAHRPKMP